MPLEQEFDTDFSSGTVEKNFMLSSVCGIGQKPLLSSGECA